MDKEDKELSNASDEDFTNLDSSSESSDDDIEDDSSDNDSDDSDDPKKKKKNQKKPAKKPKKVRKPKIIMNVSDTQYDVVKYVGKKIFKWKLSYDKESMDWDMFWTDWAVEPETLARMQTFQKINHFPGMYVLARKNHLGRNLMRMKKSFPEHYKFFPQTFLLPTEYSEFKNQFTNGKKNIKTFIVKPEASCQGRGIFLTRSPDDVQMGEHYVVQRYLQKPFLIDGLKFDMRIYVLLAGCDPLKVFLYDDGLGRFATENYIVPTDENLDNVCMHLTNYAINKDNPNFVFNESSSADDVGHKRSLKAVMRTLREMGHDVDTLWKEIKKIIIKTFCSVQPVLAHSYRSCHPDEPYNNMCFELLGFDVMIDHKLKPWLIEVNHTPSFTTDTPLDKSIKKSAIRDALKIMNISVEKKIEAKNKKRIEMQQRVLTGKKVKLTPEEKKEAFEKAQQERDAWEAKNHGRYEKIYPFDDPSQCDEDYEEYMKVANKWWEEWTGISIRRNAKRVADPNKPPPMVFGNGPAFIPPKILKPKAPTTNTTLKPNSPNSNSGQNSRVIQSAINDAIIEADNKAEKAEMIGATDEMYSGDKEMDDENNAFMAHVAAINIVPEDQEEDIAPVAIPEKIVQKSHAPVKSYTMVLSGIQKLDDSKTVESAENRKIGHNSSPSMNALMGSAPEGRGNTKGSQFRIKTLKELTPQKTVPINEPLNTSEEQKVPLSKKLSSYLYVDRVDDLQQAVGAIPHGRVDRDREIFSNNKKVPMKLSNGILGDFGAGIHHIWTGPGSLAEMYSHEYERDPKGASNMLLNKLSGRNEHTRNTYGKKVVSPSYHHSKQQPHPGNYLAPRLFELNVGATIKEEPQQRQATNNIQGLSMQGFGLMGKGSGKQGVQRDVNPFHDSQAAALQRYYNYLSHHNKR